LGFDFFGASTAARLRQLRFFQPAFHLLGATLARRCCNLSLNIIEGGTVSGAEIFGAGAGSAANTSLKAGRAGRPQQRSTADDGRIDAAGSSTDKRLAPNTVGVDGPGTARLTPAMHAASKC